MPDFTQALIARLESLEKVMQRCADMKEYERLEMRGRIKELKLVLRLIGNGKLIESTY